MREMAVSERNGSFAQFVAAPARQMFLVPPQTPPKEAALIEPSSVACHAIRRSRMELGERVVVMGAVPIGLVIIALARRAGADRIAVVEPAENRRRLAIPMGADAGCEGRRLELHANRVLGNELDVLASFWANDTDFRRAVDLVASRKLDVRPLISERVALDDLQNAFERLAADRGRYAKILVDCNS